MTSEMHVFASFKIKQKTSAIILPSLLSCLMYFVTVKPSPCMLLSEILSHHLQKNFLKAWITDGRSFMKIRNRIGPRTPPWGIPFVTLAVVDLFRPKTEYYIFPSIFRFDPESHFKLPRTYTRHRYAPSPSDGLITLGAWCNWWKKNKQKKNTKGFPRPTILFLYISGSNLNVHQNNT